MSVDKGMTIAEVVEKYPSTVEVFQSYGMGCLGCPATHYENVEQGAMVHGLDVEELVEALNKAAS